MIDPKDPIKPHTPRFPAADRETIQLNLRWKSIFKFLKQVYLCRKHKSRTEKLGRN